MSVITNMYKYGDNLWNVWILLEGNNTILVRTDHILTEEEAVAIRQEALAAGVANAPESLDIT